ncbi:MAG: alpha/beta hydrolase [Rhodoferax sp.]|nr:alpha/beta hydrolase [Rhodoferax sp.]
MKPLRYLRHTALALLVAVVLVGCAALEEKQGEWIFQPSSSNWGASAARDMDDVWIEFDSLRSARRVKLHALWHPAQPDGFSRNSAAPVLLYLHGARFNVTGSAHRVRRMQELGFSVLVLDYRGFGRSDGDSPSEALANEDARAAWDWLASRDPQRPRYIFGHSLGGALAIELASQVSDEAGTIVEGTFTSIPDVLSSMRWGWLPVGPLITQRFDAIKKVRNLGSPLLVVHGSEDRLVKPELGRKLYEAAREPKAFVLVDGGSHHNTNSIGQAQYREAIAHLFGLK